VTIEAGIPVTSIARTLMDMAGRSSARQLEHMLVAADRSGRLDWDRLRRVIGRGKGRKGLRRLERVTARVDPRAAEAVSPLEVDFLAFCGRESLPSPQVNVLVEGKVVDFYWPQARLIVETDGYTYHGDRPSFERDHESAIALAAAGYTVRRVTYRMLRSDPKQLFSLLRRDLHP